MLTCVSTLSTQLQLPALSMLQRLFPFCAPVNRASPDKHYPLRPKNHLSLLRPPSLNLCGVLCGLRPVILFKRSQPAQCLLEFRMWLNCLCRAHWYIHLSLIGITQRRDLSAVLVSRVVLYNHLSHHYSSEGYSAWSVPATLIANVSGFKDTPVCAYWAEKSIQWVTLRGVYFMQCNQWWCFF